MDKKEQVVNEAMEIVDGKKILTCLQAFHLSEKQGIPLKEIGTICNNLGIKIRECQLGCFK